VWSVSRYGRFTPPQKAAGTQTSVDVSENRRIRFPAVNGNAGNLVTASTD
jgi:hypothetical protein